MNESSLAKKEVPPSSDASPSKPLNCAEQLEAWLLELDHDVNTVSATETPLETHRPHTHHLHLSHGKNA